MFLPDHLRLSGGFADINIVFLHINIHASSICLYQAAVITAESHGISKSLIRQFWVRSLTAASEVADIVKLTNHFKASNVSFMPHFHDCGSLKTQMHAWMGLCLYIAASVFVQDLRSEEPDTQSMPTLDFLLAAMKAIGNRHSVTKCFAARLELDIESSGIKSHSNPSVKPGVPMTSINPGRHCALMTADDLELFEQESADEMAINISTAANGGSSPASRDANTARLYGVLPSKLQEKQRPQRTPESVQNNYANLSCLNLHPSSNSALYQSKPPYYFTPNQQQQQISLECDGFAGSYLPVAAEHNVDSYGVHFKSDSFLTGRPTTQRFVQR